MNTQETMNPQETHAPENATPESNAPESNAPTTANVTDPIKPTTQTSYYQIFLVSVTVGPLLVIGLLALANAALPPQDAQAFKEPLLSVWKAVATSGIVATAIGGLLRTGGKVVAQQTQNQAQSKAGGKMGLTP